MDRDFWLATARRTREYAKDLHEAGASARDLAYVHQAELFALRMAEGLPTDDLPGTTDARNASLSRRSPGIPGPGVRV